MKFEALNFGQVVKIDDSDIYGVITAVTFRPGLKPEISASSYAQYEVQWFANGVLQTGWFDGFRLKA